MPWIKNEDGHEEPDGRPFDKPADSFERTYNAKLEAGTVDPENEPFDPSNGYPLPTRMFQSKPANLRGTMNLFFHPRYQAKCLDAGNTPKELDLLAKRLLGYAAMEGTPVTDLERRVGERLKVDLDGNPKASQPR